MSIIRRWVRWGWCLLLVAGLAVGRVSAQPAAQPPAAQLPAATALSRPVRLPAGWATLAEVLAEASRQSRVPIAYSSSRLPVSRRVYVPTAVPRPLRRVLRELLAVRRINYGWLDGQVVLWPARQAPPAGITQVNGREPAAPAGTIRAEPGREADPAAGTPGARPSKTMPPARPAVPSPLAALGTFSQPTQASRSPAASAPLGRVRAAAQAPRAVSASTIGRRPNRADAVAELRARPVPVALAPNRLPAVSRLPVAPLLAPTSLPVTSAQRLGQVAVLYALSTNGRAHAQTRNRYSLNVLAGYAAGVDAVELGGLLNVAGESVRGFQGAGLVNAVGGTVRGGQLAGVANVARGPAVGLQGAGLVNLVGGAADDAKDGSEPRLRGRWPGRWAAAALARLPPAPATAAPLPRGPLIQLAGLANLTGTEVRGVQAAALLNVAQRVRGAQLGFVNVARRVRGTQLGLINVADSAGGVPIGLLNIVRHGGYVRGELWASESLPLNLVVKVGVPRYYTILGIAAEPFGSRVQWALGTGLGTAGPPRGRFTFSLDLVQWALTGNVNNLDDNADVRLLTQLRPAAAWQIERQSRWQLVVAPTLNFAIAWSNNRQPDWNFGANQLLLLDRTGPQSRTRLWPGLQVGLRF